MYSWTYLFRDSVLFQDLHVGRIMKNLRVFCHCDMLPSIVTTQNFCSAFNPSKCTHTAVSKVNTTHTHYEHISGAVASHSFQLQLEVQWMPCSRAPQLWSLKEESAVHSLSQPTIPDCIETRTHDFWVTSPTI